MSSDWDQDDLARLLALEHAFAALALISAGNFARLDGVRISEAVAQFRDAIVGSIHDTTLPDGLKEPMHRHLTRLFDHVSAQARLLD